MSRNLKKIKAALSRLIADEEALDAGDGLACTLAQSLLAEANEAGPGCFKNLPPLKQAILDYAVDGSIK